MPIEQIFRCFMARTSYISIRCWWLLLLCPLCTRLTRLVGYLNR